MVFLVYRDYVKATLLQTDVFVRHTVLSEAVETTWIPEQHSTCAFFIYTLYVSVVVLPLSPPDSPVNLNLKVTLLSALRHHVSSVPGTSSHHRCVHAN